MKASKKKSHSILDPSNPETNSTSLIEIKKIKKEYQNVKTLKQKVDKQLNFLLKKDHSLIKQYLKKKEALTKEKQKQQLFIENLQYKQWLTAQRETRASQQKKQTQNFRTKLKDGINSAYQKDFITKKRIAGSMKTTIDEWMREKLEKQQKLLELNRSRFNETQTRRTLSRESNQSFYEQRHSRIVQRSLREVDSEKKSIIDDIHQIDRMEMDLLNVRHKSENRIKLIEKIESDIMSVKNETLTLSRTLSLKHSIVRHEEPNEVEEHKKEVNDKTRKTVQKRKFSLPLIHYKRPHDL